MCAKVRALGVAGKDGQTGSGDGSRATLSEEVCKTFWGSPGKPNSSEFIPPK
jgi:hypothetical protein